MTTHRIKPKTVKPAIISDIVFMFLFSLIVPFSLTKLRKKKNMCFELAYVGARNILKLISSKRHSVVAGGLPQFSAQSIVQPLIEPVFTAFALACKSSHTREYICRPYKGLGFSIKQSNTKRHVSVLWNKVVKQKTATEVTEAVYCPQLVTSSYEMFASFKLPNPEPLSSLFMLIYKKHG